MSLARNLSVSLALVGMLYFTGCSGGRQITADNYSGYSEIQKGDTAVIKWQFNNAEYVVFERIRKQPKDSIAVAPTSDTDYLINAISRFDTLSVIWKVAVIDNKDSDESDDEELTVVGVNFRETEYFSGIDLTSSETVPVPERVKILGFEEIEEDYVFEYVVLDRFGNLITDYANHPHQISLQKRCGDSLRILHFNGNVPLSKNIDILIDDSYDHSVVDQHIVDLSSRKGIAYFDSVKYGYISSDMLIPLEGAGGTDLSAGRGTRMLNDNYARVFQHIIDSPDNRDLINIVFQNDNSSLIYTPEDLVIAARANDIKIYTIVIGNIADPLPYRYIAHQTGGKFYTSDTPEETNDILNEIFLAHSNNLRASVSKSELEEECKDGQLLFTISNDVSTVSNSYSHYDQKLKFPSKNQITALFSDKSEVLDEDYGDNIQRLANVLKDNPGYKIELIGHSGIEGESEFNREISSKRAERIKSEIIKAGIAGERIKTKALGRQKPMFALESSDYQKSYNRRVEVRWLTPFTLPYEIHVGEADTEQSASEEVGKWEKRGYRVYYDRYMENNIPIYKIVLWGYRNEEEAEMASHQIEKLYSVQAQVY